MGLATFIGGIHPFEGKELSEDKPIKYLEPLQGEVMVYPLSQHIGAPAKPLVAKGDHVLKGQIIAEAGGFRKRSQFCFRYSKGNRVQAGCQWCNGSVNPGGE